MNGCWLEGGLLGRDLVDCPGDEASGFFDLVLSAGELGRGGAASKTSSERRVTEALGGETDRLAVEFWEWRWGALLCRSEVNIWSLEGFETFVT